MTPNIRPAEVPMRAAICAVFLALLSSCTNVPLQQGTSLGSYAGMAASGGSDQGKIVREFASGSCRANGTHRSDGGGECRRRFFRRQGPGAPEQCRRPGAVHGPHRPLQGRGSKPAGRSRRPCDRHRHRRDEPCGCRDLHRRHARRFGGNGSNPEDSDRSRATVSQ